VSVVEIPDPFEANLLTKWAAGERPDVLYFHGIGNWLAQLNPAKNLVDLSSQPFVARTKEGILDNSTEWDAKIYGAVVDYPGVDGMLYNKPVFDKLNLDVPTNVEEVIQLCTTIREKSPKTIPIDIAGGDKWPLQIFAFNIFNDGIRANPDIIEQINQNKASFTDETFMRGYEGLKKAYDANCFADDVKTGTFEKTQKRIVSGAAAMTPVISPIVQILLDGFEREKVDNLHFFPFSYQTTVSSWQSTGQAIYVPINTDTTKQDAAIAYVNWITGDGYQGYVDGSAQLPVIEGATPPDDLTAVFTEANDAFEANTVPQFQQNLKATYGEFQDYLADMMFNGKSPEDVGKSMQSTFARNAQAQGLPGW